MQRNLPDEKRGKHIMRAEHDWPFLFYFWLDGKVARVICKPIVDRSKTKQCVYTFFQNGLHA